jgi:hypothetical protein
MVLQTNAKPSGCISIIRGHGITLLTERSDKWRRARREDRLFPLKLAFDWVSKLTRAVTLSSSA